MLSYKKIFLKYSSMLKIMSFNINSIKTYIWNIRNNITYLFYFIFKKTILFKIYINYKMCMCLYNNTHYNSIDTIPTVKFVLLLKHLSLLNSIFNQIHHVFFLCATNSIKELVSWSYFISNIFNNKNVVVRNRNSLYKLNYLLHLYKNLIFLRYIWLYSLKFLNFYKINYSSIPMKKQFHTVLRSPHNDKKSREKFVIRRIKKNVVYPSFLNSLKSSDLLFSTYVNETIQVKVNVTNYI